VQACKIVSACAVVRQACAVLLLVGLLAAWAPHASARVYTLAECVEIALSENTTLARAREDLEGAGANLMSSWSSVLPHVSAGLSKSDGLSVTPEGDVTSESASGNLSLSQTLLDGAAFARISGAAHSRTAAELSLDSTRREIVFETKKAYFGLLRAVRLREVQDEAVGLAREQLRKTQSLFDLGSASRSDLLKARVQVGKAELALIEAERSAEVARAGLALVLGIDVTTDIEAVDPTGEQSEDEIRDFDIERAVSSRPDVMAWEETVAAARRSLLAARAGRWPDLSLSVNYSRSEGSLDALFDGVTDDYSRSVSLNLSVPLFNGLATKASIDNSRSQLRSYELSLRNARSNAAYEIESARLSAEQGRRSVAVAEEAVLQAEEDLKVSEERFRLRAASMLELIDARVAYSRARADLVNARYDYETAKAELKLALGL